MEDMQRALAILAAVCLSILTAMVLGLGIAFLLSMRGGGHQGERFYAAAGIIIALAWLGAQFLKLAERFPRRGS